MFTFKESRKKYGIVKLCQHDEVWLRRFMYGKDETIAITSYTGEYESTEADLQWRLFSSFSYQRIESRL